MRNLCTDVNVSLGLWEGPNWCVKTCRSSHRLSSSDKQRSHLNWFLMYTMSCRFSRVCIFSSGCCSAHSSQHPSSSLLLRHPSIFSLKTTKRGVSFAWNKTQTNITFFLASHQRRSGSSLKRVQPHMPHSELLPVSVSALLPSLVAFSKPNSMHSRPLMTSGTNIS